MREFTPFTYLIGWTAQNRWYYGVRYKRGTAHPDELWSTYFTSSKSVKHMREEFGEPDVVEVRRTFENKEDAQRWETRVLRKMKVKTDDRWLNIAINGHCDHTGRKRSPESVERIRASQVGKKLSPEHVEKMRQHRFTQEQREKMSRDRKGKPNPKNRELHLGLKRSDETRKKISESLKGRKLSEEHLANISKTSKGRKHSDETKRKISENVKKNRWGEKTENSHSQ